MVSQKTSKSAKTINMLQQPNNKCHALFLEPSSVITLAQSRTLKFKVSDNIQ